MTDQAIIDIVRPWHCLKDLELELPALLSFARKAKTILEIGTYQGGTAAAMALANPESKITTIDLPDPSKAAYNPQNGDACGIAIRELKIDGISQVRMNSAHLGVFVEDDNRFDLIFVDGDHAAKSVERDLSFAAKLLTKNGVIIAHDYTEPGDAERHEWTISVYAGVQAFLKTRSEFKLTRLPGLLVKLQASTFTDYVI